MGNEFTPQGTRIIVKVEDLPKSSNVELTKICDDCEKTILNQKYQYILRSREKSDGKDRCRKCANVIAGINRKENPPYEKSLEYYALNNEKEYLLSEFSDNNNKMPKDISYGSHDDYLWICSICKNVFNMGIGERTVHNTNCPYCAGKRVLKGFNDLWSTHQHIAKLLKDKQRGYEIIAGSGKKEDFQCENCGFVKKMKVRNVIQYGVSCPKCSDGVSYPEKFVFECLSQLNIDFEFHKTFDWSENKEYDFYISQFNWIIETHGDQHYNYKNNHFSSRTLKEELENDALKEGLAKENGIENEDYVVLDCSKSDLEYIRQSIKSSRLSAIIDLEHIDWLKCHEVACKSLIKTACDLWNQGNKTTKISEIIKVHRETVVRYLKQGKILGWCDYDPKEEMKLNAIAIGKKNAKEIVQLTLNGDYIKEYSSIKEAANDIGKEKTAIAQNCRGITKTSYGFKWMFKENYEGLIE